MGQVAANAGFGPPSISVVESSTAQVLEEIRRRQLAALSQPAPGGAGAAGQQAPEPEPAEPTAQAEAPSEPTQAEAAGEKPAPAKPSAGAPQKKTAKKQQESPPPVSYESAAGASTYEGYGKGFYEPAVREYADRYGRKSAVWARGFLGWDRHSDLAPGQDENPTRTETTGGGMAGMDWTSHHASEETVQFGVFGGYLANRASFTDTVFVLESPGTAADTYQRTDNHQDIDGGFVGGYLTYRNNQWLGDLAFKSDILQLSQKSVLTQLADATGACGAAGATGVQSGSSSMTSYVIAGNIANRIPHEEHTWIAPTVGFRYSTTFFGSNASTVNFTPTLNNPNPLFSTLGLDDGQALRLQGGVRYGGTWMSSHGVLWEAEVGALLYSDVWIDGFTFVSTSGGTVSPVDEGKVRALGQAMTKINMGNGLSYILQGEVFGGEDLFGLDGQLGVRYEW
jgi:hypothetical protein